MPGLGSGGCQALPARDLPVTHTQEPHAYDIPHILREFHETPGKFRQHVHGHYVGRLIVRIGGGPIRGLDTNILADEEGRPALVGLQGADRQIIQDAPCARRLPERGDDKPPALDRFTVLTMMTFHAFAPYSLQPTAFSLPAPPPATRQSF
jgi:hypothetical protein